MALIGPVRLYDPQFFHRFPPPRPPPLKTPVLHSMCAVLRSWWLFVPYRLLNFSGGMYCTQPPIIDRRWSTEKTLENMWALNCCFLSLQIASAVNAVNMTLMFDKPVPVKTASYPSSNRLSTSGHSPMYIRERPASVLFQPSFFLFY